MMQRLKNRRGSILVTVLFVTSVLALLVAAVAKDSFQSLKSVSQSGRDTQAKYAAYAGMEVVLNELRKNERYTGDRQLGPGHGKVTRTMKGLEQLRFEVEIWNNIQERDSEGNTSGEAEDMAGPNDVIVRPDTVYIVSSGKDVELGEEVLLSSLAGTARRIRPVFEDAAYARSKMVLFGENALVDAWDSMGGWTAYVEGDFPGEVGGGGNGGGNGNGNNYEAPTVANHEASLGTDNRSGRTMRLIGGAKLNGHFRVGPGAGTSELFGDDQGTTTYSSSSSSSGGGSEGDGESSTTSSTSYAVSTATSPDNVAGQEAGLTGGVGETKAVSDDQTTEVPRFVSPISGDDVVPGPILNNPSTTKRDAAGNVVKDAQGNPVTVPPAPVDLAPGGYDLVEVPGDQTLRLTAGVYFFRDDFIVRGGEVVTDGNGPVIVFCGKKATFHNAKINNDGRTSGLQLCFTDEIDDDEELEATIESLQDVLSGPTSSTRTQLANPEDYYKNLLSPMLETGSDEPKRRGFSKLVMTGNTKFFGSVSGTNLVAQMDGGELFGSIMGNVIAGENTKIHQDLALKGSNLMAAGGWQLEGVHQIR